MPPPRPIAFQTTNGTTSQPEVASVLLVDDDRDFLLLVKEMLERMGRFEVTSAESVDEAFALLSRGRYDVIVADYLMPGATGLDMLRTLRADGNDTPFVMFTGKGREDVAIDALNSGADFYVQKGGDSGASFANLSKMIMHLVQARSAERRGHESLDKAISKLQELDSIINQSPVIVADMDRRRAVAESDTYRRTCRSSGTLRRISCPAGSRMRTSCIQRTFLD